MSRIKRIETGPVQFKQNDEVDWPGIYIRGDDCFHFKMSLNYIINKIELTDSIEDVIVRTTIRDLQKLLDSCNMNGPEYSAEKIQRADLTWTESQGNK